MDLSYHQLRSSGGQLVKINGLSYDAICTKVSLRSERTLPSIAY